jgi:hypothetical protein
MPTKRTLARQLADARQQVRDLVDERDKALGSAATGGFNTRRLAQQLNEAREENDSLRRQLDEQQPPAPAPDAWKTERSELLRRLRLVEEARASLDAQLVQLGGINDWMCREAYDRAEAAR